MPFMKWQMLPALDLDQCTRGAGGGDPTFYHQISPVELGPGGGA